MLGDSSDVDLEQPTGEKYFRRSGRMTPLACLAGLLKHRAVRKLGSDCSAWPQKSKEALEAAFQEGWGWGRIVRVKQIKLIVGRCSLTG